MQAKTTYNTPKLTFYGDIEKITFGPKSGFLDAWFGSVGAGPGGPGGYGVECEIFPHASGCSTGS